MLLAAVLVALLLLGILLKGLRRRAASLHLQQASERMVAQDYVAALWHAQRTLRHKGSRQDAAIVVAIALLRLGKVGEAEAASTQGCSRKATPIRLLADLQDQPGYG